MKALPEKRIRARIALLLAILAVGGCTWVKLSDAGATVQQADADGVRDCMRIGIVTTHTQNKVVMQRGEAKVREELLVLARNEAGALGADTLVVMGQPTDGRQDFEAYRCRGED